MKAIILAAGYATRMYPLTENTPKQLLPVGGMPVIGHIFNQLVARDDIDGIFLVTNNKFFNHFEKWASDKPVKILNDGTLSNEDRLGAIGDLNFVVEEEQLDDDIMVLAGDVITDSVVEELLTTFKKTNLPLVSVKDMKDSKLLANRYGVLELNSDFSIIGFEEKPAEPKSSIKSNPYYLFPKEHLKLIQTYLRLGLNNDAPGNFIAWLHKQTDTKAVPTQGMYWDIGNLETYKEADEHFSEVLKLKR